MKAPGMRDPSALFYCWTFTLLFGLNSNTLPPQPSFRNGATNQLNKKFYDREGDTE